MNSYASLNLNDFFCQFKLSITSLVNTYFQLITGYMKDCPSFVQNHRNEISNPKLNSPEFFQF